MGLASSSREMIESGGASIRSNIRLGIRRAGLVSSGVRITQRALCCSQKTHQGLE